MSPLNEPAPGLDLARDGAAHWRAAVPQRQIDDLIAELAAHAQVEPGRAGTRSLLAQPWCRALAAQLRDHPALQPSLAGLVAVQCTYFEKSTALNWLVTLHQDLSVPVAGRIDAPGWQGWAEKEGQWFAQPPAEVLGSLLAVRLHLDRCGIDDGPLRVVPGSHLHGRLDDEAARQWRERCGETTCLAEPGDVLVLRPLTLHASSKARGTSPRRVLHIVYGPASLPDGARWALVA